MSLCRECPVCNWPISRLREQLLQADRQAIATALGENLAYMQQAKWPISGRYKAATDAVEPFELAYELAWPFPIESDLQLSAAPQAGFRIASA